ncbi:hypothetical protein [Paenibacillus rigui]|uniref:Uncharacterized protein n=1 Tax=Paenibacillus rigui TaxID=554312 RepID=A0A229ULX2_9BACL|nr:hypothetical protein [Paenibacillus rigui]OXM84371.1 hypothetical protein CF651_21580 [Paenibacillus rigui]
MTLNLDAMKQLIYQHAEGRLRKSYGIVEPASGAGEFHRLLLQALKQQVKPIQRQITNEEVFEAAVKSIGSNSRDWSTFIAKEPALRKLLAGYNPVQASMMDEETLLQQLRPYFPGTSCSTDCRAVAGWVRTLSRIPNYYAKVILNIVDAFHQIHGDTLPDEHMMICMSGLLSSPSSRWKGWSVLAGSELPFQERPESLKLHGMGYALASEFFRNLGWNGFKPDRHIKRLFAYWYNVDAMVTREEIQYYTDLIGSHNKDLADNIRYSLVGHKMTPEGVRYSEVDNLVWALGAYVLKKGKEQPLTAGASA